MCSTAIVLLLLPDVLRPTISVACESPPAEPVASTCMPAVFEQAHLPETEFPFMYVTGASLTVSGSISASGISVSSLRSL